MSHNTDIWFNVQVDCEATQHSVNDPALGERAIRGLGEIFADSGMKGTFVVIPSDLAVHAAIYKDLESAGHEVGLHVHPADQGYQEFLGVYGFDEQVKILEEAIDIFAQEMGRKPTCFTPGYCSANDYTFPALEAVGFTHGMVSIPTRNLPQCASIWGNSPLEIHYPHRFNRSLIGNVDFVDVPMTVDTDSRMWGGAHPQDLRVELVDAKNHWYTIQKNVVRQVAAGDAIPVKHLKCLTHNTFEYGELTNFRRETLLGIIAATQRICEDQCCRLIPATTQEIAEKFRRRMPCPQQASELKLDVR